LTLNFEKSDYLTTIIGSIFSGFFVYSVLSYLYVAPRITIPISIVMSMLIFGLTKFYSTSYIDTNGTQDRNSIFRDNHQNDMHARDHKKENGLLSTVIFVTIFTIAIVISAFSYKQEFHIFVNWNDIGGIGIIQLVSAIMLCFFIPGYGIVRIITKKYEMNPILTVLLAYLLSVLITGLTAYISALTFDNAISESKNLFIGVYLIILIVFLISYPKYRISPQISLQFESYFYYHFVLLIITKFFKYLKTRASELLVFGSLLMLLIIYMYYLYGGITIGDQWYHQGRALLFMSGSFREAALSNVETFYPPFQSALLAALTSLSGIPLVNSYASIAFLNMTPLFAFYYFFLTWVPTTKRKAALLACSLFMISSGFGWIYLLSISVTSEPIISPLSSLESLVNTRSLDIVRASNFIIATAPDFSTGLIYIALPAGFTLLGIVRTTIKNNFTNIAIVTAISVLGIISHDEFYFFIIIASILPLIFRMKSKNYLYLGFVIAFLIIFLIDIITPGKYLTLNEIFGLPLLLLSVLFVVILWTIYLTGKYLHKMGPKLFFLNPLRKLLYHESRFNFITGVIVVFVIAYVFLLSFNVLNQLPLDTIKDQTDQSNLPWYLYPMRMGLVGVFGFAFVVSYVFKRFEKQIFVFGIIIVISFVTGPYYDENRFSKYTMVGMIGFASLMIYKILIWRFDNKPLFNVILISIVIISSSLSILMYIGFNSLILQTQDYNNTQSRRHFPSMSELRLFEFLHDKIDVDSKKYNVVSFPKEYNRWEDGIMSKIQAFAGAPNDKLLQNPLTLNSTSLDALYRQLDYSDARYILVPKYTIQNGKGVTEPIRFAFDYFKHIYEDNNYIVLEVPPLEPPDSTSKPRVALLYKQGDNLLLHEVSDIALLPYNNKTFDFKRNSESVNIQIDNQTKGIILFGTNMDDENTLWSKTIPETRVREVEARFRIISDIENKTDVVKLRWLDADKEYSISLSKNGLELYQELINKKDQKLLARNSEVEKKDGIWYTIRIESLNNLINIYINNVLKIQASKSINSNNTEGISKVGLTSHYNDVEFTPLKMGSISDSAQKIYEKTKYYDYYYPLSFLGLSKTRYDIFSDDDLSVFSKDIIVTSDTMKLDKTMLDRYLEYVYAGGRLIVINSNNNFTGNFSQLFSIQSNVNITQEFTKIVGNKDQNVSINIPGLVRSFEIRSFPDVKVIASYRNNNNQTIAPFIIEKIFSNGGRILLINAGGYYNAISNSPQQYFSSLSNISDLVNINLGKVTTSQSTSLPKTGFIGNIKVSGEVTLNSSSLSMFDEANYPYLINAQRIAVFNKTDDTRRDYDNVVIKSLKLIGHYEIIIKSTDILDLPGTMSNHNYISMNIPSDFNMTVNLSPKKFGYVEVVTQNHSSIRTIKVSNDSKIEFYKIKAEPSLKFVPLILKNPQMKVIGNTSIKNEVLQAYLAQKGQVNSGVPLNAKGELNVKFDFIEHYNEPYHEGIRTKFITYLQSITMDGSIDQPKELFKLPGDIPSKAKEQGKDIPLKNIMSSSTNILILTASIIIAIIVNWLLRRMNVY
jgi:hypothetical protein